MSDRSEGVESWGTFEVLTLPLLGALYRFARCKVTDAHDAEDVVQETCLKAHRAFAHFRQGTDYPSWLFRILLNTIQDWHHQQGTRQRMGSLTPLEVPPHHDSEPEGQLMAAELQAILQAAIDALPPAFQDVFLLSVVQGFSYQQIARTLDLPRGTVMSRLSRARQFLRQRLVPYLTEDHRKSNPRRAGRETHG